MSREGGLEGLDAACDLEEKKLRTTPPPREREAVKVPPSTVESSMTPWRVGAQARDRDGGREGV